MAEPFGSTAPIIHDREVGVYNHRFPGQMYDVTSELFYNYYRDYDPSSGRYTQSDPIGLMGGGNTYAYVAANPTIFVDPMGTDYALSTSIYRIPPVPAAAAGAATNLAGVGLAAYTGWTIGSIINGAFEPQIQNGVDWMFGDPAAAISSAEALSPMRGWISDPEAQREYQAYKRDYLAPRPPGLDECETLRWELLREQNQVQARQAWDAKWMPGRHALAIIQGQSAINNIKRKMKKAGCECP